MKTKLGFMFLSLCFILFLVTCGKESGEERIISQTYREYHQAIIRNNLEQLKKLVIEKEQGKFSDSQAQSVLTMIQTLLPKEITIKKTTISGESADLRVEGKFNKKTIKGTVKLLKEGGKWKIAKENWEINVDLEPSPQENIFLDMTQSFMKDYTKPPGIHQILEGHQGEITSLAFTPDNQFLVSASYGDYSIRIWKIETGEVVSTVSTKNRIRSMQLSSDGTKILTADAAKNILVWPLEFGGIGPPQTLISNAGDELAISPDREYIATTGYQLPVKIWNFEDGELVKVLKTSADQRTLTFSISGKWLGSGGGQSNIYNIWQPPKWRQKSYKINKIGKDSFMSAIDFSPDGELMATGHNDSSIVIYDLEGHKELFNFYVPNASTMDVKFSLDSSILATAQYDKCIYLWESRTGKQIAVLKGHTDAVTCLTFNPDGTILASGGEDRKILIWRSSTAPVTPEAEGPSTPDEVEVISPTETSETSLEKTGNNLVKNPGANQNTKFWNSKGEIYIQKSTRGNPHFVVRFQGYLWQDIPIPESYGRFALLISWTSSERINDNNDITGLPYLYGYMLNKSDHNRINAYLQGQKMMHSDQTPNEWCISWGIFRIPENTGAIRLFLQQASGGSAQTGSAARFDSVGIYLFDSEEEARTIMEQIESEIL